MRASAKGSKMKTKITFLLYTFIFSVNLITGSNEFPTKSIQQNIQKAQELTILDDSYLVFKKNWELTDAIAETINEHPLIATCIGVTAGYYAWKGFWNANTVESTNPIAELDKKINTMQETLKSLQKNNPIDFKTFVNTTTTYNSELTTKNATLQKKENEIYQLKKQINQHEQDILKNWEKFLLQHPQPAPIGLANNGNTCYRNATLQALHHLYPSIYKKCLEAEQADTTLFKNQIFQDFKTFALYQTIGSPENQKYINLKKQFVAFEKLCTGYFKGAYNQEDAAEFFTNLYETLQSPDKKQHYDLKKHHKTDKTNFTQEKINQAQSAIGRIFESLFCKITTTKTTTSKNDKNHCSQNEETLHLLQVSLPEEKEKKQHRLEDLLKVELSKEELIEDVKFENKKVISLDFPTEQKGKIKIKLEKYSGEKANSTTAIKKISEEKNLFIQLKRFSNLTNKNQCSVTIPKTLTIPKEAFKDGQAPPQFCLKSIVFHIGTSLNGGHYIAHVLHNNTLHCCNDLSITTIDKNIKGDPYLLFYERVIPKK